MNFNGIELGFAKGCSGAVRTGLSLWLLGASLAVSVAAPVGVTQQGLDEISALLKEKASWSPAQSKLESHLIHALKSDRGQAFAPQAKSLQMDVARAADGRVLVDIRAQVTPALLAAIQQGGGEIINSFPQFHAIRAWVQLAQLESLAGSADVGFIRRADQGRAHVGSVTSQGDATHRAAFARSALGVTGAGIKVGVLSDSVDYLSSSQANGDLGPVIVLPGQTGSGIGEGTAMLEIIHDLAPGAQLHFATALYGQASYAQNILDLRAAGCDIIVDDYSYFNESPFQDGIVAQAVNAVTASGALYFSAAGNSGNEDAGTSGTWEGDFVDGGAVNAPIVEAGRVHSFGALNYNRVTSGFGDAQVDLFWADPLGASTNDYDVFVLDSTGSTVTRSSTTRQTASQDPYEGIGFVALDERIVIVKYSGAPRFLHLGTGRGALSIHTPGATFGHSAALGALSVAAVSAVTAYPDPFTAGPSNHVETFSSDGPRRLFFNPDGSAVTPGNLLAGGGVVRQKPDLAAADHVSTSVPTFVSFSGTSAAAPHAAAIAALLLNYHPGLPPSQVRSALLGSALDIGAPGVDRDSGAGIAMAYEALQWLQPLVLVTPATAREGNGVLAGQAQVRIPTPLSSNLTVALGSSDISELTVPATVVISAGNTNATFDLTIVDDAILDGTQTATLTASAPGYANGSSSIAINDNETAVLTVNLPGSSTEGDSLPLGFVGVSAPVGDNVRVNLASSDETEIQVPPFVTIPAGQTYAVFLFTIVDDLEIDGSRSASVTAHVNGWTDGSATMTIRDNESTNLIVSVRGQASEAAGVITHGGSVGISGTLPTNLTVFLTSSDSARLSVQASVIIPAGQTSVPFDLTLLDNALMDGSEMVTVSAHAARFGTGNAQIIVYDDESQPPPSNPFPPDLASNISINTHLAWKSINLVSELMTNGGFETGDFTGWFRNSYANGDFIINDGTVDPPGPSGPLPSYDGHYSALAEHTSSGAHSLYQPVTIPSNTVSAVLSWAHLLRNCGDDWTPYQQFRVEVQDAYGNPLEEAFITQPGDLLQGDWVTNSFDLANYIGQTIQIVFIVSLDNFPLDVLLDDVSVQAGFTLPTTFDVYFGTNPNPSPAELRGSTTNLNWALPALAPLTNYYWRIVGHRLGTTPGPIWRFTTRGVEHFEWSAISSPQFPGNAFHASITARDENNGLMTNFNASLSLSGTALGRRTNNLLGGVTNTSSAFADETDGYAFTPSTNIVVTHFRHYFGVKVSLWTASGILLASQNVVSTPGTWVETPLAVPVELLAGQQYRLGVYSGGQQILGRYDGPSAFQDGTIDQGYYNPGDNFPGSYSGWRWVLVDCRYTVGSPTAVALAPTNAVLTNGIWSGDVIVGAAADRVRLLADDGAGHTGQSNPFDVLLMDDLGLTVSDAPKPVPAGANLTYTLTVRNAGPSTATGVSLTDFLPANAVLAAFSSSQGACSQVSGNVQCDLGDVAGGASVVVTIVVVPSTEGVVTNRAVISRVEPDPDLSNNSVITATPVTPPALSIKDVSLAEGDAGVTLAVFEVVLSGVHPAPVTVGYSTQDGTATGGVDYLPTNGVVTFNPSVSTQFVTVQIKGDNTVEPDETFSVYLANPINAVLANSSAIGTILNDDGLPGHIDHFAWAPIPGTQFLNQPFPVTLTAQDVFNGTVTSFAGSVAFTTRQNIGSGPKTILGDQISAQSGYGDYTLGYSFTPNSDLIVTHFRHYFGTKVSIWTDSGLLVASQNVTSAPGAWVETPLQTPAQLQAGQRYRLGVYTGNGGFYARSDGAAIFGDGTIDQEYYTYSDGFPNSFDSWRWMLVDLRYAVGSSLAVGITPTNSAAFTNGGWSGNLTVLDPSSNLILLADDGRGHQGSANPFSVIARNDLGVTVSDSPDPVAPGDNLAYSIFVTNIGPLSATGVMVTNVLPSGVAFVSALASQGACTNNAGTVICNLGTLTADTNALVTIVVTTGVAGNLTNRTAVSRLETDAYAGNNSATTVSGVQALTIGINDVGMLEGDSGTNNAVFTVQLSSPTSKTVQVGFFTADNSAVAGSDYLATSGTLMFLPGQTNKSISVPVRGDVVWENDETFLVNLYAPVNAVLARSQGVGTITNDDAYPTLSISDAVVVEGNAGSTNAIFTLTLSAPSSTTISCSYATADGSATAPDDYVAVAPGAFYVNFSPGQTSATIAITVNGDTSIESNETFVVNLYYPNYVNIGRSPGIGTILNDDGLPGQLDHFAWSFVASPQYLNQPFSVMLTAQDALNATVTNFAGPVALSGNPIGGARGGENHTAYLRSLGGQPWGGSDNETLLTKVFGTNWADLRFESADPAALFSSRNTFIFMDGSDGGALAMSAFLNGNRTAMSSWVEAGGSLFLDAAPNTGGNIDFGFGVTLIAYDFSHLTGANNPAHPIFNGPYLPVGLSFNGSAFGHGTISGSGVTALLTNADAGHVVLAERSYGAGHVLFGGMTLPQFHSPQPQAPNLRANILAYGATVSAGGLLPIVIAPTNSGTFTNGVWSGSLAVLTPATNLFLRADDGAGHRGSSSNFAVLVRDDLAVSVTDTPDPVAPGGSITYSILVTNTGPSIATGVVLTNLLPASAAFVSVTTSQGACANNAGTISCNLGSLSANTSAAITVVATASATFGSVTNRVSVFRAEADAFLANNSATNVTVLQTPALSVSDVTVLEGNSGITNAVFNVRLSPPSSTTVQVNFSTFDITATAGTDYLATNGTLVFAPGQTNKTVSVPVLGDILWEGDESFLLRLSTGVGTNGFLTATGTILNDEAYPAVSVGDVVVVEGNSGLTNANFQISINPPSSQTIYVYYYTSDGSADSADYFGTSGMVTVNPGQTNATLTVAVRGDTVVEPDETFFVYLYSANNAAIGRHLGVGKILNDDGLPGQLDHFAWGPIGSTQSVNQPFIVNLTAQDVSNARVTNFNGTVALSAAIIGAVASTNILGDAIDPTSNFVDATIGYAFTPNVSVTVTHVRHYYGKKVSIWTDAGALVATRDVVSTPGVWTETPLAIPVILQAGLRYRVAAYSGSGGGPAYYRLDGPSNFQDGTIDQGYSAGLDNFPANADGARWSFVDLRYSVGISAAISVTPAISGNFTNGLWSGNLTVPAPATNMTLLADDHAGHSGVSGNFTVLLRDDIGLSVVDSPNPVASGENLAYAIVVTNVGPSTATSVTLTNILPVGAAFASATASQGSCNNNAGTVVCNLGSLAANADARIMIVAVPSALGALVNRATVTRAEADTFAGNNSATNVTFVQQPMLTISDISVVEGNSGGTLAVFTLQLSPPTSQPVQVNYATADGSAVAGSDYLPKSGTVLFSAGQTNRTFVIPVLGDIVYEGNETFFVNLSNPVNAILQESQAMATILDDDPFPVVSVSDAIVMEGNTGTNSASFTVSLFPPSGQTVMVQYYTQDGNAITPGDYSANSGYLTFNPGQTNLTINVTINGDTTIEPDEAFLLYLYSASYASIGHNPGVGLILNDDGLPGQVDHFAWNTVTPTQFLNQPFPVTITALDAFNATATNFNGALALSGRQGGGSKTNTILGDVLPVYSSSGTYTLAYAFTPNTNIVVSHVRHRFGSKVSIWTDAGALVASQNVVSTSGLWTETPLATPVQLLAGQRYRLGVYIGGGYYEYRYDGPGVFADGTIDQEYYGFGDAFPNNFDGPRWILVDLRYTVGTSRAVAFTPTNTDAFSQGVWSGSITVLEPASNMVLRADDQNGHQGSANPISVLLHDDIGLTLTATPEPVGLGENLTYSIVVTNIGPSAATGVTVTDLLAGGVNLVSVATSQGACSNVGKTITCNLGTIAANTNVIITVVGTANSLTVGNVANRATVTRGEPDGYSGNNSMTNVSTVLRVSLSINDVSELEGDTGRTNAVFQVQLSPPTSKTVQVNFATANLTAVAGSDYVATNGTLVFLPGETNKTIPVPVLGDILWENDEMFLMNLSSAVNAVLVKSLGTNTIINDEAYPGVSFSDPVVTEGDTGTTNAVFNVSVYPPSSQDITVFYYTSDGSATSPSDYVSTNNASVLLSAGQTNATFAVAVKGDTTVESDETFFANINYVNGNASILKYYGVATILNDDGLPGRIDHFAWDAVPSPQYAGQLFPVRVTALDTFNAVVTNFTGPAALAGIQPGGSRTNNILGGVSHTDSGSGDLTIGYAFTPGTNLLVTHVRHYFGTKVSIWTDGGTLLASQNVSSVPGTWRETPLATPLQLSAGQRYRVAAYSAGGTIYGRFDGQFLFTDGTIDQSAYTSGDGFPNSSSGWQWTSVDLRYTVPTSLPVAVAPASSGSFTNGGWGGTMSIQSVGTNVQLRADDLRGHSGLGNAFNVFLPADLSLSMTDSPDPAVTNSPITYTLTVFNPGPAAATGIIVSNLLPANVSFVSATSSQGACASVGNVVTCNLGSLAALSNAVVRVVVIAPGVFGDITNRATVSQNEADPNPANNSAFAVTSVPNFPPLIAITSPADGATFAYSVPIPIMVAASDSDGLVTKVEFFNRGAKIGQSTNSPFSFNWTNAPAGLNPLIARATDNGGIVGTSAPVAITVLPAPPGSGIGIYGEYFDNINLTALAVTRIDPFVSFNWFTGSPDPAIGSDTFSVRWTGQIQPLYSDVYTFYTDSDDGVRLYINNQLVIDNFTDHVETTNTGTFALQAGQLYSIRLEYFDDTAYAIINLFWSSASQSFEIVPQAQLYPLPVITADPVSRTVFPGSNIVFSVVAFGQPPLTYQWTSNGVNLAGATSASLLIPNAQTSASANYAAVVTNPYGAITSAVATLVVGVKPTITADPASQIVLSGSNVVLTGSANGTFPLSYRWRKPPQFTILTNYILNAFTSTWAIPNAQTNDAGTYTVVVTNLFGSATNRSLGQSSNAILSVVSSQTVNVVTNQGSNVTFLISAASPGPLFYSWRFNSTNVLTAATNVSLTLTNVQSSQQGGYYAMVSNSAGAVTTLVATLTVIPRDSDTNGLGDDWELTYFTHIGVDPSDDPDHDGMSNLQEYIAGTNPTNALSVLSLQLSKGGSGALLRFSAMPSISYTLQYRTNLPAGQWLKFRDVAPQPGTNTVEVLDPDPAAAGRKFYRIATPQQP